VISIGRRVNNGYYAYTQSSMRNTDSTQYTNECACPRWACRF